MKISTIIPVYNSAGTLARAIESFNAQTYKNKQIIIIDGSSTDGSVDIARQFVSGKNTTIISEPDQGILDAWNKGIGFATGEWVHFLGADDFYYDDNVFSRFIDIAQNFPSYVQLAAGDVLKVDKCERAVELISGEWDPTRFRKIGCSLPHQGIFHRREFFKNYGLFENNTPFPSPYELLLRHLKNSAPARIDGDPVVRMSLGGLSNQIATKWAMRKSYRLAQKKHGLDKLSLGATQADISALCQLFICRALGDKTASKIIGRARGLIGKADLSQ